MARRVSDVKKTLDLQDRLRGRVGERYLRILRRILGDGLSYADATAFEGEAGPRGTTFIAESFRCALEDAVSAVQQARGVVSPVPDDKHTAAAAAASVADRLPTSTEAMPEHIIIQD